MGLAADAISWLMKGVHALRRNRALAKGVVMTVIGNNDKIARRVERYFDKMAKVEEVHGAHTNFWNLVEQGATTPGGVQLPQAECRYALFGKRAFDDTLKPIGKKIGKKVGGFSAGVDDRLPDVPEVPELSAQEDDDGNIDSGGPEA